MQFKVPQFLEIEDKIFGPFTFREFAYLVGGAGMCFVLYKALGLFWAAIPMIAVAGFSLMLTFYKPNSKPFIDMLESMFKYTMQDKLYIWQRRQVKRDAKKQNEKESVSILSHPNSRLTGSKLRDLAWSLDVLDSRKQSSDKRNLENKETDTI